MTALELILLFFIWLNIFDLMQQVKPGEEKLSEPKALLYSAIIISIVFSIIYGLELFITLLSDHIKIEWMNPPL